MTTIALAVFAALGWLAWWRERSACAELTREIVTMRIAHPYVPAPKLPEREPPRKPDAEPDPERDGPVLEGAVAQLMANGMARKDALIHARAMLKGVFG